LGESLRNPAKPFGPMQLLSFFTPTKSLFYTLSAGKR